MNTAFLKMIKFITKEDPERHVHEIGRDKAFVVFLYNHNMNEFFNITKSIDSEGFEAVWKGSYFCVDIIPFIEYYGEDIMNVDDFIEIVGTSD